jgi:hypothetical protein
LCSFVPTDVCCWFLPRNREWSDVLLLLLRHLLFLRYWLG